MLAIADGNMIVTPDRRSCEASQSWGGFDRAAALNFCGGAPDTPEGESSRA